MMDHLKSAHNNTRDAIAASIRPKVNMRAGPTIVAICGSQGSGKSTVASSLKALMEKEGVQTAILSLDDLYLEKAARHRLAHEEHELLLTRGVPGTHDVALGLQTLDMLRRGEPAPLPRFDKARDDRSPPSEWPAADSDTRLLILEGWCVGARPELELALAQPFNALEADEDSDGRWRRYVNGRLAGDYQDLFGQINHLVLLAAPNFDIVFRWRAQQEEALYAQTGKGMTKAELRRFVDHYERLTRHILVEMPARADLVIQLDERRVPIRIIGNDGVIMLP